jgi:hypothetical protein
MSNRTECSRDCYCKCSICHPDRDLWHSRRSKHTRSTHRWRHTSKRGRIRLKRFLSLECPLCPPMNNRRLRSQHHFYNRSIFHPDRDWWHSRRRTRTRSRWKHICQQHCKLRCRSLVRLHIRYKDSRHSPRPFLLRKDRKSSNNRHHRSCLGILSYCHMFSSRILMSIPLEWGKHWN